MKTYVVTFDTSTARAWTCIAARTPRSALAKARAIANDKPGTLRFKPKDIRPTIEEIAVVNGGDRDWRWLSEPLCRALVAGDLLKHAREAVACWETAGLAAAVHGLAQAVAVYDDLMRDGFIVRASADESLS